MTESNKKTVEDILQAVNGLHKKADEILFELEVIGTEIREKLNEADAAALAEEALEDKEEPYEEDEQTATPKKLGLPEGYWDDKQHKYVDEKPVQIGESGQAELEIW